jgi:hypothetical protein
MDTKTTKPFNGNSFILIVIGVVVSTLGWSLNQNVLTLKEDIRQLKSDMAPRHEVEIQLRSFEQNISRNALDIADIRLHLTTLEVEMAKLKKL